jgi:hypothetical protein
MSHPPSVQIRVQISLQIDAQFNAQVWFAA